MILNIQSQTLLLVLRSFLSGCVLCAVYDVLVTAMPTESRGGVIRVLRGVWRGIADLLICICFSILALLIMYYTNRGFFRALVILVMSLGFLVFKVSIGMLWRRLCNLFWGLVRKILRLFILPLIFIKNKLISLYLLTIGRIIDKIKLSARQWITSRRLRREEKIKAVGVDTPADKDSDRREDFVYVGDGKGYRKNGRIRF